MDLTALEWMVKQFEQGCITTAYGGVSVSSTYASLLMKCNASPRGPIVPLGSDEPYRAIGYAADRLTGQVYAIADDANFDDVWAIFSRIFQGVICRPTMLNVISNQVEAIPSGWMPTYGDLPDGSFGDALELIGTCWGIAIAGTTNRWSACIRTDDGQWQQERLPGHSSYTYGKQFVDVCQKVKQALHDHR